MCHIPKISIILTSYNQKTQLRRAFKSLITQTYKNIEIIIVDDCSSDGESQQYIIHLAMIYPSVVKYYFQEHNVGIAKNKNTGFKLAQGDYITYLDGDDYYLPIKIEQEIEAFQKDNTIDVVYSNFVYQDNFGNDLGDWAGNIVPPEGLIFDKIITRRFPKNTLFRFEMMKAEVLKKINYYDEELIAYHDWDSRIRYAKFCKIKYVDNVGSVYVQDPAGVSKSLSQLFLIQEMEKVFDKNKPLLRDLPRSRQVDIVSEINDKFIKSRLFCAKSVRKLLPELFSYLFSKPADYKFVLTLLCRRLKTDVITFFSNGAKLS